MIDELAHTSQTDPVAAIGNAKAVVVLATFFLLGAWLLFCLVVLGSSALCAREAGHDLCVPTATPLLLAVAGLAAAVLPLWTAWRGRTHVDVLVRGGVTLLLSALAGAVVLCLFLGRT